MQSPYMCPCHPPPTLYTCQKFSLSTFPKWPWHMVCVFLSVSVCVCVGGWMGGTVMGSVLLLSLMYFSTLIWSVFSATEDNWMPEDRLSRANSSGLWLCPCHSGQSNWWWEDEAEEMWNEIESVKRTNIRMREGKWIQDKYHTSIAIWDWPEVLIYFELSRFLLWWYLQVSCSSVAALMPN